VLFHCDIKSTTDFSTLQKRPTKYVWFVCGDVLWRWAVSLGVALYEAGVLERGGGVSTKLVLRRRLMM
jgi:hypothetical protein